MGECRFQYIDTNTGSPVCGITAQVPHARPNGAGELLSPVSPQRACIPAQLRLPNAADHCSGNPDRSQPIPPSRPPRR